MALEITGKVYQILNKTEGVSKAGKPWSKQEFVIETEEQFPRKVCMSVMNEKVNDLARLSQGERVKVSINIESREYQSRWYTDVRAWKIESQGAPAQSAPPAETFYADSQPDFQADPATDDLPF